MTELYLKARYYPYMKKMTKIIALLLALIMTALALFACDNGNTDMQDGSEDATGTGNGTATDDKKPGTNSTDKPKDEVDKLVIFENGEYKFRVICPDKPSDIEKKVYNDIRAKLKGITGINPEFVTDFKAFNDTGEDRELPAILVGRTNYDESTQVYSELRNAECALKVVGNKIVLAFNTEVDATNAYIKFYSLIRQSKADYISMNADVNYTKASNEYLNELPTYTGGAYEIIDCDDNSYMLYAKNATKDDFYNYHNEAICNGFLPYVSREVDGNFFETLITDTKYIYMYYRAYDKSVRAIIGPIDMLGEEDCGDYGEKYDASLTLVGQVETIDCGQGYIFVLPDGRLIIQDGGSKYGAKPDYMYQAIKQVAPDPDNIIIGAWFISHPHSDHQRGFTEFVANHADDPEFTIERIVANYINKEMYQYTRPDGAKESNAALVDELRRIAKEEYPEAQFIKAHTGQVYNFGSSSVEVLYTVEDYLPAEMFNYVNSASLVIRVTVDNTSVMLLADTTHASGKIMEDMFGTHLKSDMVQLAHHGMAPSNASLYKFIQADVLLWPSTYNHAGSRYGQYSSVINVALEYAEDVYVSDVALTTLKLPYVIQNNKDAEMSKLGK